MRYIAYLYYGKGRRRITPIPAVNYNLAYDIARKKLGRNVILEDTSKQGIPFSHTEDNREDNMARGF